jgi:hypothetical protein
LREAFLMRVVSGTLILNVSPSEVVIPAATCQGLFNHVHRKFTIDTLI